ncbi:MAG TPA: nucleotide exchange factor GrpE [Pyrinomonadaceae bacterium]|nr:nucleotide exchange factor GrpE [Pyrinomonadaceae bacterium]
MDPNQEIDNPGGIVDDADAPESVSVDDFIRQLEEKEKDLHIDSDSTVIEIDESYDDDELPDFMKGEFEFSPAKLTPAKTASAPAQKPVAVEKAIDAKAEQELGALKEKLAKLQSDRDELLKSSDRRAKDFANFKSRTERERQETLLTQVGNLATRMLPAIDNLNRAIEFALVMPEEQRNHMQQFFDGIVLVNQQINEVLAEMGVQPIATVGEAFDPHLHEAVATEPSAKFAPNTISTELLRGYRIGDRVIRHSMVKVATAPEFEVSSTADADAPTEEFEVVADVDQDVPATPVSDSLLPNAE